MDTSAWIEYLAGTQKGVLIRSQIEKNTIFVTGMIVTELCAKFLREEKPVEIAVDALRSNAILAQLDFELAYRTAQIYHQQRKQKPKFGIVDAQIVATARAHQAKILTCDTDFLGLPDAIVIK